jgi:hypothetical protein
MLPTTRQRVPASTDNSVNARIARQLQNSVRRFSGRPADLNRRLQQLDAEWDIERAIEANASALAFTGIALGAALDKRFLILPAMVTVFLFQHAVQGWCPPVPVLRRLGFRTAYEIEQERQALKALRGDFADIATTRGRTRRSRVPRGRRGAKARAAARAVRA